MPSIQEIFSNPEARRDFNALPREEQLKVMGKLAPEFNDLPSEEQQKVLDHLGGAPQEMPPDASQGASEAGGISGLLSQVQRPVLEGLGAFGGGILGAPLGPAGAMAGGGMGYSVGNQIADLIDEAMGVKGSESLWERLAGLPQEVLYGAAMEGGDRALLDPLIGKVVGKVLAPFATKITPETQGLAQIAERRGVPLTPADINPRSKTVSLLESGLEKAPFSGDMIGGRRQEQLDWFHREAARKMQQYGGEVPRAKLGEDVLGAMRETSRAVKDQGSKLFKDVGRFIGEDETVPLPRTKATAQELLDRFEKSVPGFRNESLIGKLQSILRQEDYSFSRLDALKRDINDAIDFNHKSGNAFMTDSEEAALTMLKKGLYDDLGDYAAKTGGDVKKAYDRANAFWSKYARIFEDPKVVKLMSQDPERFVDVVVNPRDLTGVRTLKKTMKPETFKNLQGAAIKRLFAKNDYEMFSPQRFKNQLYSWDRQVLEEWFGPEAANDLEQIARLGEAMFTAEKRAGNPSGTAQNLIQWLGLGYIIVDPLKGTAMLATPPAIAKLYLSKTGRKYLTDGFQMPLAAKEAGKLAERIMTVWKGKEGVEYLQQVGTHKLSGAPVFRLPDDTYWTPSGDPQVTEEEVTDE